MLKQLAADVAPGAVDFRSAIDTAQLSDLYRAADAFVCLSEHEGFCIPLLEAFHFGVPVIARDAGAVAEVAGDAALLLSATDDLATTVELLRIVVGDESLRQELSARAERRLEVYDHARTASTLRSRLTALARAA
jgi:glycosyltransferase involved in cell wall biosynthesis